MPSSDEYLFHPLFRELRIHAYKYDKYYANSKDITTTVLAILLSRIYSVVSSNNKYILDGGVHKGFRDGLVDLGFTLRCYPGRLRKLPSINLEGDATLRIIQRIFCELNRTSLEEKTIRLITENYDMLVDSLSVKLRKECYGLVLPSDLGFFNKIFIDAAKIAKVPTFILQHGAVPVIFKKPLFDTTDYLVVWGEATKDAYISKGWDPAKVLISGYPSRPGIPFNLRSSLENVLVCTKPRAHDSNQDSWQSVQYITEARLALQSVGVKKAVLRMHPSEDKTFYEPFIEDFYLISSNDLGTDARNATLVIGPQSTFIVDAYFNGVAYIVYEPVHDDGMLYFRQELSPVIEAGRNCLSISNSYEQLCKALLNPFPPSEEYIQKIANGHFDLSFVSRIISG